MSGTVNVESRRLVKLAGDYDEGVATMKRHINNMVNEIVTVNGFKTNLKHELVGVMDDLETLLNRVQKSCEGHQEIFQSKVDYIREHEGTRMLQQYQIEAEAIRENEAKKVTNVIL